MIDNQKEQETEFKHQMRNLPETKRLRIATIFSYGVNEAENDNFVVDENSENTDGLDQSSRDFQDYQSEYIDLYHEFKPKKGQRKILMMTLYLRSNL